MDKTPIYTELQEQLMDPEENNWGLSAPPEFAAALAESAESASTESSGTSGAAASGTTGKRGGRSKRRHRAED